MCAGHAQLLSHVQLFATSQSIAHQAPLSMRFSQQHYHSLLQWMFLTQGLNLSLPHCRQILHRLSQQGSSMLDSGHLLTYLLQLFSSNVACLLMLPHLYLIHIVIYLNISKPFLEKKIACQVF